MKAVHLCPGTAFIFFLAADRDRYGFSWTSSATSGLMSS